MRGVVGIAACALLAAVLGLSACGATEGPLLRALSGPERDGGTDVDDDASPAGGADPRITPGMSFQYQLTGEVDPSVDAELFVVDLFLTPEAVIDALHDEGRVVACYLSAGTLEPYRDDAARFPDAAVGRRFAEYPDESWLDVRDATVRALMAARLDRARSKGFDAVLTANLTAYAHDSGFPLTAADQLDYTRWLTAEARARGLAPGMSGDYAQADALVDDFTFAMHFGCVERGDCAELAPFTARGKPAFDVEYAGALASVCREAERHGITAILKRPQLDAYRVACP